MNQSKTVASFQKLAHAFQQPDKKGFFHLEHATVSVHFMRTFKTAWLKFLVCVCGRVAGNDIQDQET